jgi:hypothetical protein
MIGAPTVLDDNFLLVDIRGFWDDSGVVPRETARRIVAMVKVIGATRARCKEDP